MCPTAYLTCCLWYLKENSKLTCPKLHFWIFLSLTNLVHTLPSPFYFLGDNSSLTYPQSKIFRITFEYSLSFISYIHSLWNSCWFHLQNTSRSWLHPGILTATSLVQAITISLLDLCLGFLKLDFIHLLLFLLHSADGSKIVPHLFSKSSKCAYCSQSKNYVTVSDKIQLNLVSVKFFSDIISNFSFPYSLLLFLECSRNTHVFREVHLPGRLLPQIFA